MRYRIITARANGGYHGYVAQRKAGWWAPWRDICRATVFRSQLEARLALDAYKGKRILPLGWVVYQEGE